MLLTLYRLRQLVLTSLVKLTKPGPFVWVENDRQGELLQSAAARGRTR